MTAGGGQAVRARQGGGEPRAGRVPPRVAAGRGRRRLCGRRPGPGLDTCLEPVTLGLPPCTVAGLGQPGQRPRPPFGCTQPPGSRSRRKWRPKGRFRGGTERGEGGSTEDGAAPEWV